MAKRRVNNAAPVRKAPPPPSENSSTFDGRRPEPHSNPDAIIIKADHQAARNLYRVYPMTADGRTFQTVPAVWCDAKQLKQTREDVLRRAEEALRR